ncbi:hypothetical protein HHI36_008210 [Cryptolaemus montrouzieri]|uniref:Uncharacterized protein n=1 Tax=Cryptolaemus montrouzieri TaxID=559131 RepID=A0ABD2MRV2_9CUCU
MDQSTLKTLIKDTITEVLSTFKQQMKDVMKSMKESVQFMSDSYEEYREQLKTTIKENKLLQNRITISETKIDNLEQRERSNNLVNTGIPNQKDKDVGKEVQKVLTPLKVTHSKEDIYEAYQIGKNENAPIILKLETMI